MVENPNSDSDCMNNVILSDEKTEVLIKNVVKTLHLEKLIPEHKFQSILSFSNDEYWEHVLLNQNHADIDRKTLENASEMFVYLSYCPPKGSVKLLYFQSQ